MSFIVSLLVGLVVGAAYGLIGVKSPAPPFVALIGLLGMVIGEQGLPLVTAVLTGKTPPAISRAAAPDQRDPR